MNLRAAEGHSIRIGNYDLCQTLGSGTYGKVKLGVHCITGHQVAVKIVSREKLKRMDVALKLRREIQNMRAFRHPHIVKLYQVISTPTDIFLVMEYVSGGELFQHIVRNQRLPESEARRFFQQLMSGLNYCHRRKVVHRDLKPENLLLDASLRSLKIADFGLSNITPDGELLRTSCGSPNYAAPEVVSGQLYVGPEVDIWSSGIILYALLCGCLPFDDEDVAQLYRKIRAGNFSIPSHVPEGAADLLCMMLQVDPMRRASMDDIRRHPWFLTDLPPYLFPSMEDADTAVVDRHAVAEVAQLCGVTERAVLSALLSGDPQSSQLAVAYQLVLDRKLAEDGAAVVAERRERVREFYVASDDTGAGGGGGGSGTGSRSGSGCGSRGSRGSGCEVDSSDGLTPAAASRQHPERMARGVPMSRNLEVATSSRGARARWHLGLRSQSGPYEIMQEVFNALLQNNFEWKVINDFRVRVRRLNAVSPEDCPKMSLQLFLVEKDSSYLLDFRLVLPESQQNQDQQPSEESAILCDGGGVDWLAVPATPSFSHTIQFFEMASAVITSLTR